MATVIDSLIDSWIDALNDSLIDTLSDTIVGFWANFTIYRFRHFSDPVSVKVLPFCPSAPHTGFATFTFSTILAPRTAFSVFPFLPFLANLQRCR